MKPLNTVDKNSIGNYSISLHPAFYLHVTSTASMFLKLDVQLKIIKCTPVEQMAMINNYAEYVTIK